PLPGPLSASPTASHSGRFPALPGAHALAGTGLRLRRVTHRLNARRASVRPLRLSHLRPVFDRHTAKGQLNRYQVRTFCHYAVLRGVCSGSGTSSACSKRRWVSVSTVHCIRRLDPNSICVAWIRRSSSQTTPGSTSRFACAMLLDKALEEVGVHAERDVRQHPPWRPVVNGANLQGVLEGAKGPLHLP